MMAGHNYLIAADLNIAQRQSCQSSVTLLRTPSAMIADVQRFAACVISRFVNLLRSLSFLESIVCL